MHPIIPVYMMYIRFSLAFQMHLLFSDYRYGQHICVDDCAIFKQEADPLIKFMVEQIEARKSDAQNVSLCFVGLYTLKNFTSAEDQTFPGFTKTQRERQVLL